MPHFSNFPEIIFIADKVFAYIRSLIVWRSGKVRPHQAVENTIIVSFYKNVAAHSIFVRWVRVSFVGADCRILLLKENMLLNPLLLLPASELNTTLLTLVSQKENLRFRTFSIRKLLRHF